MFSQYLEEFEVEEVSVETFIERLTKRSQADFDINYINGNTEILCEFFIQTINDLKILKERTERKCVTLEEAFQNEKNGHRQQLESLEDRQHAAIELFRQLDEKINLVAGKIIHLGEQLDNINIPRRRVSEAQTLLGYIIEFLAAGTLSLNTIAIFNDATRLFEAADAIQKLYLIAQDLPEEKFSTLKKNIDLMYDKIEKDLIERFASAHHAGNIEEMKKIANVLSNFKGYSQCVDVYIEQSQDVNYSGKDIFDSVLPLCQRNYAIIEQVFSNPNQVMSKFILNIYQLKINQYAHTRLDDRRDERKYLKTLYELYVRTLKLSADIGKIKMNLEDDLLNKLSQNIFAKYLRDIHEIEIRTLDNFFQNELRKFYEAKKHNKRPTERFSELKRDMQALISTKANINISQIDDFGGETFLSEELAIAMLQEYSQAFERCKLFSDEQQFSKNVLEMTDVLLHYLLHDHICYALDIGLQAIPFAESKTPPVIYFFDVVHKANTIVHLLESTFNANIAPYMLSNATLLECTNKKRNFLETINNKINNGLDRALGVIIGWVKFTLQNEQKKSDFKPETDTFDTIASTACRAVVPYIETSIGLMKKSIDGENLTTILGEFGFRLHRCLFDHLTQFQYNTVGAMCAICDINEYRKCVRALNNPLVTQLFDILHALCNLLLVKPENLLEVCCGDALNCLEKSVVMNFIQLRSDYKTIKLSNTLKGI
ncbi:exocyst complex component 5 [Culicoides brevitarsis]|uniref:exocyst complex component 5 n=1 Tax=Culicoides brevitarsis TaxID=469753 RepID=UPI00307CB9EE